MRKDSCENVHVCYWSLADSQSWCTVRHSEHPL